jgi:hypothetical protein
MRLAHLAGVERFCPAPLGRAARDKGLGQRAALLAGGMLVSLPRHAAVRKRPLKGLEAAGVLAGGEPELPLHGLLHLPNEAEVLGAQR